MGVATFQALLSKDSDKPKSLLSRPLGPYKAYEPQAFNISETNAVELQFALDPAGRAKYRSVKAMQWAATQAFWYKMDSPLTSAWIQTNPSSGDIPDNPLDANTGEVGHAFAFWDCPGPSITKWLGKKVSRLYVVQNFKVYLVGVNAKGVQEQLSDLVCWCSVADLLNAKWSTPNESPDWQRRERNDARLGWADTNDRPPL